jgi:hypothetical protein
VTQVRDLPAFGPTLTRRGCETGSSSHDVFFDVPISVPSGEPQAESSYTDGSGALFSMYLDRAEEEDRRVAERWKGDADGILVFVRSLMQTA